MYVMSLSSAASTTQSGLSTITAEIAALTRNISGATDTTVYSRKIANVATTSSGAQVVSLTRASNQAVFDNVLSATAATAAQQAISAGLDALNQTIGDVSGSTSGSASTATSPAALISSFDNALQTYSASPSDSTAAAAAVAAAKSLVSGMNSASVTVQQARETADSGMASSVAAINSLLTQFQTANQQVVSGLASGADVTDAQDQRDTILQQLSQQIGISTTAGSNGEMSIYGDSGVTLFQGGVARTLTFEATHTYTASTAGNAVYVDGAAITGGSATMPIASGNLAGLATLRDTIAPTYQTQLDNMAGALINSFAESDQAGAGPSLPGLFTTLGATALPGANGGLASQISVNASVDPSQGGNANLLRDGGISDTANTNYTYNTSGASSFTGRLSQLTSNLSATQTFSSAGGIATSASLSNYAAASVSWLEAERSSVSSSSSYQSTLLSTASTALSNATGVNINDEMSKMLDLEQSFSASAKLLTSINDMFNALAAAIIG
ncbi:Flagellar hook-associated protein FlgK [Methylocella tundrae]|uniref:Flagellar hook-associated protein 1 n=2 Tax=Methylocella tundrae TaxID=227605 RepID=A0A8B6M6J7_METTU|nr:Flagellar hook-associated protein FlgK [Methylocella tundrae]VTZ50049.1 Flagellar hook-associated protein FlgK [Methylocella tundrae]